MALIDFTGFDDTINDIIHPFWSSKSGSGDGYIGYCTGRFGIGRGLYIGYQSGTNFWFYKSFAEKGEVILGVGVLSNGTSSAMNIQFGNSDNNVQSYLNIVGPSNTLKAYCGGVLVDSVDRIFPTYTWNYIEIKCYLHSSAGYFIVRFNEQVIINQTGINTLISGSNPYISQICFNLTYYTGLDDLYICDDTGSQNNDFLGDVRVDQLTPTANGTTNDGVPLSGSNYENVDGEYLYDDTDYVTLDAINEIELYALEDLPSTSYTKTIIGVRVNNVIKLADAGTREVDSIIRTNSINYLASDSHSLGTSNVKYGSLYELNPDDSAAWEESDINALESGIKVTV